MLRVAYVTNRLSCVESKCEKGHCHGARSSLSPSESFTSAGRRETMGVGEGTSDVMKIGAASTPNTLRRPNDARVILVQSAPRLLVPFDPVLSENARLSLLKLNVEVRLDQAVTMCDAKGVSVGGERVEAATIIWAAGVMASPAGNWLGAETDKCRSGQGSAQSFDTGLSRYFRGRRYGALC